MKAAARGRLRRLGVGPLGAITTTPTNHCPPDNIQKVLNRGERLEDLNERSENLAASSEAFKNRSKDVRMKMFWQDAKTRLMLGGIALVVIGLIIGLSVWASGTHNATTAGFSSNPAATTTTASAQ
ncbi:hypothetical protein HDU84_006224 [Entophlyctis sp. JEL0112]|nr:hypothetical protein HDU84_006224 [Entophlyctis sp. JEL0112]